MKTKKASRRLAEIEELLSEVIEGYGRATEAQRQEMAQVKAAVTRLKTSVLSESDKEVPEPPSQPLRKKPTPPSKKTGKQR